MEEKTITKLSSMTANMYASIMGRVKDGYYAVWHPKIQQLILIVHALVEEYEKCTRGKVVEEHYQALLNYSKQVEQLEEIVFERGDIHTMNEIQKGLSNYINEMQELLEKGVRRYEKLEERVSKVYVYEEKFIADSKRLNEEYKEKIQNRIRQNISKVHNFGTLSEEERKAFMTRVILFDEGKIENTILEYLHDAERKVEEEFTEVERKAIISGNTMERDESRAYVHKYRKEAGKKSPKELSISRKLLKEGEINNKFELWFENLMGKDTTVGKLIDEGATSYEVPMEISMYDAIEAVVDGNVNELSMKEMIDAYTQECAELKERSFAEFYGEYDQIKILCSLVQKSVELFPEWDAREVGLGDILLNEF